MKIIEHRVNYKYGDTIKIKPISDVHLGHRLCDTNAFKKFITDEPDALYVGLGDMLDSIVCTDKRYSKAMDATEGEGIIDEQIGMMYKMLFPIREKIIGLGEGNHERRFTEVTGSNPTKRLSDLLGVPYLGYTWMCEFILSENGSRGRSVIIYGNHGWGGGCRTRGGDITKYSKKCEEYESDIYLFGHVHRLNSDRIERLGLAGKKLIAKDKHIIICGTFLKTISPDAIPSWAETRGFPPTRIGGATISIRPTRNWVDISVTT